LTVKARQLALTSAAIAAAVVAVWIYRAFDPSEAGWFPPCLFKAATGLDCPGCGTQRAFHALLHGDLAGAWGFNAAFVLSLPLIALLVALRLKPGISPLMVRITGSRPFILTVFFLFVAWTIMRNIPILAPD
jgi:hypothetical protein